MRGQTSPSPIYEGEDGVIARLLDGPDARYSVPLPGPGEAKRAILDSYTKEHSAEYQAQAWIDLARRLGRERPELRDPAAVRSIVLHTSHHTHVVIGSGAGDPQKYDPTASRETLDHSIPYIVAVALQDGEWHHERSYAPERAQRPDTVELWRRITTAEDAEWTRRYHSADPAEKAFGGRIEVEFTDGSTTRRRDRRRRRAPARRAAVRAGGLRAEVPHAGRGGARTGGGGAVPRGWPTRLRDARAARARRADAHAPGRRPRPGRRGLAGRAVLMLYSTTDPGREARRASARRSRATGSCACPARSTRSARG